VGENPKYPLRPDYEELGAGARRRSSGLANTFSVSCKHAFEVNKKALDGDFGESRTNQIPGAPELHPMMCRLARWVSAEGSQSAAGAAIGMAHEKHSPDVMQQDGHPELLQNEVPLTIIAGRSQGLGAAGDNDHVRPQNAAPLQEFVDSLADALVEAREHGRVGDIRVGGGVEVEDLIHNYFVKFRNVELIVANRWGALNKSAFGLPQFLSK